MPKPVVIRDKLYPEQHDALLEVLGKYTRQAGNQIALSITEACMDIWPLTEADYNIGTGSDGQNVKLQIDPVRYPRIWNLYQRLPRGVKGQVVLNLLNRHQMMRLTDPKSVTSALNAFLDVRAEAQADHPRGGEPERSEGVVLQPEAVVELNDALLLTRQVEQLPIETREEQQQELQDVPDSVEEIDDPLSSLPPMEFT